MTQQQLIVNNRKNLLIFAQRHGISEACRHFGYSRTTYYKLKKQFIETHTLEPKLRSKPRMPNETKLSKKKILLKLVRDHPSWGPKRYAYEFKQLGIYISPVTIWERLKRLGLNTRYKRLVYIEQLRSSDKPLNEKTIRTLRRAYSKIKKGIK